LGLLVKAGDYTDILEAGEHRLSWFGKQEVTIVELNGSDVRKLANYLRRFRPEWVEAYCLASIPPGMMWPRSTVTASWWKLSRQRHAACSGRTVA
jgi:hypothetical protein